MSTDASPASTQPAYFADFEQVVRSNIQEVLDAVAHTSSVSDEAAAGATAAPCSSTSTSGRPTRCGHHVNCMCSLVADDHARPLNLTSNYTNLTCCRDAADGWLDAKLLEVPANSDATIRLLRARIKSLEEQLGTALTLSQGECCFPPPCRPSRWA